MLAHKYSIVLIGKDALPGKAKTRLAQHIGDKKAAQIYAEMAIHICSVACASPFHVEVSFRGNLDGPFAHRLQAIGASLYPQVHTSLGDIIWTAMQRNHHVLALGMDMPLITQEHIRQAFSFDGITIGPAFDGGYWCISGQRPPKELFNNIEWSTPKVLNQTLENSKKLFLPVQILETKYDIDTLPDLNKLLDDPLLPSSLHKRILPYA